MHDDFSHPRVAALLPLLISKLQGIEAQAGTSCCFDAAKYAREEVVKWCKRSGTPIPDRANVAHGKKKGKKGRRTADGRRIKPSKRKSKGRNKGNKIGGRGRGARGTVHPKMEMRGVGNRAKRQQKRHLNQLKRRWAKQDKGKDVGPPIQNDDKAVKAGRQRLQNRRASIGATRPVGFEGFEIGQVNPAAAAATGRRKHPRLKHAASAVNMHALKHAVMDDHDVHVLTRSNSLSELVAWHDDGGTENRRAKSFIVGGTGRAGGRGRGRGKKRRGTTSGGGSRRTRGKSKRRRELARAQSSQRLMDLMAAAGARKEATGSTALSAIKEEVRGRVTERAARGSKGPKAANVVHQLAALQKQLHQKMETKAALQDKARIEEENAAIKARMAALEAELQAKVDRAAAAASAAAKLQAALEEEKKKKAGGAELDSIKKAHDELMAKHAEAQRKMQELEKSGEVAEEEKLKAKEAEERLARAEAAAEKMRVDFIAEQEKRRKLHNAMEEMKGSIRVFSRVRPFSSSEKKRGCSNVVDCPPAADRGYGDEIILTTGKKSHEGGRKKYTFDRCFTGSDQAAVFNDVKFLVQSTLDGFNVCIFAYGQTGSGKTFTMNGVEDGPPELRGITPRAVIELFDNLDRDAKKYKSRKITTFVTELYRDGLVDLLRDDDIKGRPKLVIKHNKRGIVFVQNVTVEEVDSAAELQAVFDRAVKQRHVTATDMNSESSRSHLICSVMVETVVALSGITLFGKLTLVDLAGSERVGKSNVSGEGLKEAQSINKSLSALGDVISALTKGAKHIPYRNHPLTHMMSDSIGGNAKTLMFVNVSPADYNAAETQSSLDYALRVKKVKNKAKKEDKEVAGLKAQLAALKAEMASNPRGAYS